MIADATAPESTSPASSSPGVCFLAGWVHEPPGGRSGEPRALGPGRVGTAIRIFSGRFNCIKLKSNEWFQVSKNIKIKCFSDWNQDATLLVDIMSKDIVFNQNDGKSLGWSGTIKKILKNYQNRFLLKLACWGDADMINIYDENNKFIGNIVKGSG